MDAHELARWTRFAAKGGIGRCTALVDCIAQEMGEDLMFLKDDEITVLMQLPEPGVYLGHCEGVVGRFFGKDVQFHGKLKKPIMAKRGSLGAGASGSESRMSISMLERSSSRSELAGERIRHTSESPSNSRPGSRAKGTPSPSQTQTRTHAPMQSYATSYSQFGDDQSTTAVDSRGTSTHTGSSTSNDSLATSVKTGHTKPPAMAASISGASVYSVGSASVYSEVSTATSIYSDVASRVGSMYSLASDETERDDGEHGLSIPDTAATTPSISASDTMLSTSGSPPTADASFASTLSHSPEQSFEVVGSITELEAKNFDMSKYTTNEPTTAFTLVPSPLGLGDSRGASAMIPGSPSVAPLRLGKSPRLTPSPRLPPTSPVPPSPLTSAEMARTGGLSPGIPAALSPRMPGSLTPGLPGSLSPGFPGSLAPGQRSPGLTGSLSPGLQYTFSSGSRANSPNPSASANLVTNTTVPARTHTRTPPTSSSGGGPGTGQPYTAPLSPPPSSPLPPLPSGAVFAASAAVSGRSSPLMALSARIPSPAFPMGMVLPGHGRGGDEESGKGQGRSEGRLDEGSDGEEGNSTKLSTLDAFRRRMEEEEEDEEREDEDTEEGEPVLRTGGEIGRSVLSGVRDSDSDGHQNGRRVGVDGKEDEDAHSDGEVGIGLSLMGALEGDDDDDEEQQERMHARGEDEKRDVDGAGAGTNPVQWTRYTPTSPLSPTANGRRPSDTEDGEGEDYEDDGGYWDDIYDDYRYSRYSLASKRMSVLSKASGASKASSRSRANAPPMPAPPDRPSVDVSRPSIGSDGTGGYGYVRPSVESPVSPVSGSVTFTRPGFGRSESEDSHSSTHSTGTLSTQFPAAPVQLPLRTESRLKIVHDGYTQGGDDHEDKEVHVVHGSTEDDAKGGGGGAGIEVAIESVQEDDSQGQEVHVARHLQSLNTAISPLLHTTFGSPHSSRFTDLEDGSDNGHGQTHTSLGSGSGNVTVESLRPSGEVPPMSPIDGGGMASALRAKMEAERVPSIGATLTISPSTPLGSRGEEPTVRPIVVDDDEGHPVGVTLTLTPDDSFASTSTESTATVTPPTNSSLAKESSSTEEKPTELDPSNFLRPRPANQAPHPFVRTSMFLPHPNAPKVTCPSPGPMYGRTTTQPSSSPALPGPGEANLTRPPAPSNATWFSAQIFHQLRTTSIAAYQQTGPARRPPRTVYGRCQSDLSTSTGPVPILFSLDPLPPLPMPGQVPQVQIGPGNTNIPQNMPPTRAATVSAPVRRGEESGKGREVAGDTAGLRLPKRSATALASGALQPGADASLPIQREGFVPQVGAARPRSRSFSEFGAEPSSPVSPERSREEPVIKLQDSANASAPSRPREVIPPALRSHHALSPLSLHMTYSDRTRDSKDGNPPVGAMPSPTLSPLSPNSLFKPPPSPLAQSFLNSPFEDAPSMIPPSPLHASPVPSSPLMPGSDREKDESPVPASSGAPAGRTSVSSSNPRSATSPQSPQQSWVPVRHASLNAVPRQNSSDEPPRQSSDSSDSHSLPSPPAIVDPFSPSPRSSPLVQELSLKSKLSLPALRTKANPRPKVDDTTSIRSLAVSGENETIQVQDMDFELVKPSIPHVMGRASQDSSFTGRDVDGRLDASPLVTDTASLHSPVPKSPLVPTHPTTSPDLAGESADAHRQREAKWMALFPTVPPSQARKNKKVRKLLQEGVPSSLRYLVWCHLTDSKARALPGVYATLGKKSRVSAFAEIERDAAERFPDQTQLHKANGPIASLLQAYLSMVPDIQYSSGLTCIAGHLLLLAPEEDAFWIFASVMDAHLRPYFSAITTQIEIDGSLFSKALEAIDPALGKKLYMSLSINPTSITRPWFSTLFVGTLSVDHLHRVWDIFLYDGVPYLYRIGLVIVNCVRHLLLQATSEEAALAVLAHPPSACLPSASELLILAANVKLKDDDVRKQRAKMEQQLKRTTQARPPNGVTNVLTTTISRPKP